MKQDTYRGIPLDLSIAWFISYSSFDLYWKRSKFERWVDCIDI